MPPASPPLGTWLGRWFRRRRGGAAAVDTPAPTRASVPDGGYDTDTALLTDTGPVREHNEDSIAALNTPRPGSRRERTALVVLADGMGGHQAGERASREAVQAALAAFSQRAGELAPTRLATALEAANAAVYASAQRAPELEGMGTTLLLFAPGDEGAHCAWVGDSRLYRWHEGLIEQLTRDDTLVMDLLDEGILRPEAVADHPDRSVLAQAVGTHATIPRPHVAGPFDLAIGDRFLLCSDGVHDVVTPGALAEALGADSAAEAVRRVHALALAHRADDNLSIAVVRVCAPALPARAPRSTAIETQVRE